MNVEENRLRTFSDWPTNAPVDARRIAKAGFYYTGENLEVKCFSCGGRISEWNYNDKVMTRHRGLNPTCSFVVSPALSGNMPLTSNDFRRSSSPEDISLLTRSNEVVNPSVGSTNMNQNHMRDELSRLRTFYNWPVSFIVTAESLAKAGFYYVQQGDKVRCAFCCVIIGGWEDGDDPMAEHRRHSPDCSHVQLMSTTTTTTVPDSINLAGISIRNNLGVLSDIAIKSLGVQSHRVAKHPKYISKDSRVSTYTTWPGDVVQTPEDLAEAGFYYAGSDDQVRCFHCDGGLRQWDPSDDPWVEHARWFPECGYIMLVKGRQFINDAIQQYPPVLPDVTKRKLTTTSDSHQVSDVELETLMNSPTVNAVLRIGLDLSRVKMAVRQRMEQTGTPFTNPNDLIEAALDIQHEEVPYQDSEETWSTPLHSPVRVRPVIPRRLVELAASSQDSSDSESETTTSHQMSSVSMPSLKASEQPVPSASLPDIASLNCDRKGLEEENRRLREARLCKICMDSEVCIVFLPCGHLVTCVNCAYSLADCPVCRHTISATVRTFLS